MKDRLAPDHDWDIYISTDPIEETDAAIQRVLGSQTWTPECADEIGGDQTEPAYIALLREGFDDVIHAGLRGLKWERLDFECDNGILIVVRER